MLLLVSLGDYLSRAPWLRILEDVLVVCREHYGSPFPNELENPYDPIPEDSCKHPDIQSRPACLQGWDQTFACIPSIFMAVPYAGVADKYGRKIFMFLGLLGSVMSLFLGSNCGVLQSLSCDRTVLGFERLPLHRRWQLGRNVNLLHDLGGCFFGRI